MNDKKLWKVFSEFIRLRDADENGFCKCFTCGRVNHWKKMDCGHGLGRQHKGVKFHEKNNHAQCGPCNLDGGRQDVYKAEVNKRYGAGTWDLLELASRKRSRITQFDIDMMENYYKIKVQELKLVRA